jgi:hypothetical protein
MNARQRRTARRAGWKPSGITWRTWSKRGRGLPDPQPEPPKQRPRRRKGALGMVLALASMCAPPALYGNEP